MIPKLHMHLHSWTMSVKPLAKFPVNQSICQVRAHTPILSKTLLNPEYKIGIMLTHKNFKR